MIACSFVKSIPTEYMHTLFISSILTDNRIISQGKYTCVSRDDELGHHDIAVDHNTRQALFHRLLLDKTHDMHSADLKMKILC